MGRRDSFDRQGNLWSASSFNVINEYTAAQLNSVNPTPVVSLTVQNASDLTGIAFDSSGNLWMVDPGPCHFYAYNAATLATQSGTVTLTPDISILPTYSAPGEDPLAIAFDAHWNM
jgi:hypothetical protein